MEAIKKEHKNIHGSFNVFELILTNDWKMLHKMLGDVQDRLHISWYKFWVLHKMIIYDWGGELPDGFKMTEKMSDNFYTITTKTKSKMTSTKIDNRTQPNSINQHVSAKALVKQTGITPEQADTICTTFNRQDVSLKSCQD